MYITSCFETFLGMWAYMNILNKQNSTLNQINKAVICKEYVESDKFKPFFYGVFSYLVFTFLPFYEIHGIYKPYIKGNIVNDVKRYDIITQRQFSMLKFSNLPICSSNLYQTLPQTMKQPP